MDSASKVEGTGLAVGDNSNAVEQQISTGSPTEAEASASDIAVQNLDSRLQDMLRNFHTTGDRVQRSAMATEMGKLADAGVPKPQIASALGYLFRDENSVEVKTDILNELGDMEDPSAYDQIVQGLDQRQPDEVRVAAIEALDSLGDKRALPILQPLLTDRDEDVRDAAQSAIDSLNDQ
jgi:HEAT repeat protein